MRNKEPERKGSILRYQYFFNERMEWAWKYQVVTGIVRRGNICGKKGENV